MSLEEITERIAWIRSDVCDDFTKLIQTAVSDVVNNLEYETNHIESVGEDGQFEYGRPYSKTISLDSELCEEFIDAVTAMRAKEQGYA